MTPSLEKSSSSIPFIENRKEVARNWQVFPRSQALCPYREKVYRDLLAVKEDIYLELKREETTNHRTQRTLKAVFSQVALYHPHLQPVKFSLFSDFLRIYCCSKENNARLNVLLRNELLAKIFKKALQVTRPMMSFSRSISSPLENHLAEIADLVEKEEAKEQRSRSLVFVFRQLQAKHSWPSSHYFSFVDLLRKCLPPTYFKGEKESLNGRLKEGDLSPLIQKTFNAQLALLYLERLSFFKETPSPSLIEQSERNFNRDFPQDPHLARLNSLIKEASLA